MAFAILEHLLPVYCLKYHGLEADDIIAMLCRIISDDVSAVVWSGDRDLIQLQQKIPQVKVYDPQKKDFFENPGYDIVTYKSILGDQSDNIPGIRGIGKKSVTRIVASSSEFIKQIASKPERYVQYRTNLKIIDLIDNDLPIPGDIPDILKSTRKYSEKDFSQVALEYDFHDIVKNKSGYNSVFYDLALKSRTNREWFFNREASK
jgi:DNA polymerase-1